MVSALPSRVMNYKVSAASPTDELITIGQILSEVGDYAGSFIDREHLSFTRKCATKLKKVVEELVARRSIQSPEDLYEIAKGTTEESDLSEMTIGELHRLYRQWPMRRKKRLKEGREHFTCYYEGQIVSELQSRKAATKDEQLKIDYCIATYNNELDNMSFILSCPVKADDDKSYPDRTKEYSPSELADLIGRYSKYHDVIEREILIEYVDYALDSLKCKSCNNDYLRLLTEIADLGERKVISVPMWINSKLKRLQKSEVRRFTI